MKMFCKAIPALKKKVLLNRYNFDIFVFGENWSNTKFKDARTLSVVHLVSILFYNGLN